MLQAASQPIDDQIANTELAIDSPSASIVALVHPVLPPAERYGARSGPNIPAIAAILLIHALAIGALIQVRNHVQRMETAKLTVVNLTPPPPPPAAEAPPPPPSRPEVVAPPPIVQTPAPPIQTVQTTPDPVPVLTPAPVAVVMPGPPAPAAPPAPPSMVQGGDLGAQMIAGKPPRYPVESRRKHEQGTVVLSLIVGLDGAVESISVAQSSGSARLDNAARDAVKGWRWKPILRSGQPVRVKGVVEIPFILRTDAA
ncbi:energy transducer TonB [Sphingobium lactosutens]|uniref:energy transducer TonB n=1 Tax=Sphingobium lactosutens TaxID=522773 RepID=UPI0015C05503|nr:energy transducer TonB [Sphingobium lactosutens]NWK95429.1 energy transducer TonB [Sphingobium lactosutens]